MSFSLFSLEINIFFMPSSVNDILNVQAKKKIDDWIGKNIFIFIKIK